MKKHLPFIAAIAATLTFCVALVAIPSCSKQTQDTLKSDTSGCAKAIPIDTYVQVVLAGVAAAQGDTTKLEQLGISIGEQLVVCAAQDLVAIFTAKAQGSGSGSSTPSTAQPEPLVVALKAYVDKHKK